MMMKILFVAFALCTSTGAWEVRKLQQDRILAGNFDFLISYVSPADQPLCITATDGLRNFGNLKLMPCDFVNFPPEQLWNLEPDCRFYNDLGDGNEKCMGVNHGQALFDGVRMRLADCIDDSPALNDFAYNGTHIRLFAYPSYCITNRGATAHVGDTIHAKPCQDRDDFKWKYTDEDPRLDGGELYSFYADGGCIQPKNGSTEKFTEIIIDECDNSRAWNVKQVDGVVIFRSRLDINMCMQTGLGGYVDHGTKLRLMPCDETEEYQKFDWSDETPIKLASRDDLCMEWRGRNVNVGVDPVIMKKCDKTVYEGWSGDSVQ